MCSDPLDPDGEVRECSVGCTIGVWDMAPLVLIKTAGRYTGFLGLKSAFSSGGVVGAAEFRVFLISDNHDRRYMSVHVARGLTSDESVIS